MKVVVLLFVVVFEGDVSIAVVVVVVSKVVVTAVVVVSVVACAVLFIPNILNLLYLELLF